MALVDYSSGSDDDAEAEAEAPTASTSPEPGRAAGGAPPPAPAQKGNAETASPGRGVSRLPPLPSAFHDLYASTVRPSTVDDPALHQGRTRQIPHVAGNWPSHLYIEWFPTPPEHAVLAGLLSAIQAQAGGTPPLHSFLSSDLGAPLPLHVSLSRPFVLRTDEKDSFLAALVDAVASSGVAPFCVSSCALSWHRSPASARAFLVLRVQSARTGNPELVRLLGLCNRLVAGAGQPELYAGSGSATAFHVSLAWAFADDDLQRLERQAAAVYSDPPRRRALDAIELRVGSVKAKIGNVVTSIPLTNRALGSQPGAGSLFGAC